MENENIEKNREEFLKAQQHIKDQITQEIEAIVAYSLKEEIKDPTNKEEPL